MACCKTAIRRKAGYRFADGGLSGACAGEAFEPLCQPRVARRQAIRETETPQENILHGPWPDASDSRHQASGPQGGNLATRGSPVSERQLAGCDGLRGGYQVLGFRPRESEFP